MGNDLYVLEEERETALSLALSSLNVSENIQLTSDKLDNGLTLSAINNIHITNHAYRRIKERLKISHKPTVDKTIREYLKNAIFVGSVVANDGNESLCYSYNSIGIYLEPTKERVVTVKDHELHNLGYALQHISDIKEIILEAQLKKMKQLNRRHKKLSRVGKEVVLDYNVEIAELERRAFKTKSESVRISCNMRVEELKKHMELHAEEIKSIEKEMRMLSKSICTTTKTNENFLEEDE